MIGSPIFTREDQGNAIRALAERMQLGQVFTNTLRLMAENRRLFVVPAMIAQLKALIAADRGEVTAEVATATPLTEAQTEALARTLGESVGKEVRIHARVDETLIGGMVVRVGSRMIDTSIRAKLLSLQNTMKEVGL
jgi:F-type H+-transporting ATPase subunit delta